MRVEMGDFQQLQILRTSPETVRLSVQYSKNISAVST